VKTIVNKTHEPIQVPLPRGKVLHLGPNKSGQISHKDIDHEPLQQLIEAGKVEIEGDGPGTAGTHRNAKGPHEETHGHHPPSTPIMKGDR
jgi:hypothetical protein